MPRLLIDRLQADCVSQFRAAAVIRDRDAWHLARAGRGTAAIYLWGYAAEMTLKAAWFSLLGFSENRPIDRTDLRTALATAKAHGITWPQEEPLHAVHCWAQLLVHHRANLKRGYTSAGFSAEILRQSDRVYERWRTILRYKRNRAYPAEVQAVAESARWLLYNSLQL